jgi:hypothetical protein
VNVLGVSVGLRLECDKSLEVQSDEVERCSEGGRGDGEGDLPTTDSNINLDTRNESD